jgi:hypothetical protein
MPGCFLWTNREVGEVVYIIHTGCKLVKRVFTIKNYLQKKQKRYILVFSFDKKQTPQKRSKGHYQVSNLKTIKLIPRATGEQLSDLTDEQLARIGELALLR